MNNPQLAAMPPASEATPDAATVIPVIEERLEIGRRQVETGAVRLRKIVHHEVFSTDELLQVETIEVERVAVGREVDGEVGVRHEGDVTIVPVLEERLVTRKQLFLVEEIRLTRSTRAQPSTFEARLRREEVIAARLDVDSGEWRPLAAAAGGDPTDG